MALINCPECGKEISDKVKSCPHCGYPLVEEEENQDAVPQPVEVTGIRLNTPVNKKKIVVGLVVVGLVVIAAFAVYLTSQEKRKTLYMDNLKTAHITMLVGAVDAESLCNLTEAVWRNTIYEKRDSTTNEYTLDSSFRFNDDFNVSLKNLYADKETIGTITKIKDNQKTVSHLINELQNPPSEYSDYYETVMKMYDAYLDLTNLATSPSGNLTSYSEKFTLADNELSKHYNRLKSQLPEK